MVEIPWRNKQNLSQLRARLQEESDDSRRLAENLEENPICSVRVDDSVPCIWVTWKRYATRTQFRFIHECILHMLEKYCVSKILGDDTALPMVLTEEQAWVLEDWMPRAIARGLKFAASKKPNSHFGRVSVNSILSAVPLGLTLRSFDTVDDARAWLQSSSAS